MQQQNMGERTPQGTPRHAGPKPLNTPEERPMSRCQNSWPGQEGRAGCNTVSTAGERARRRAKSSPAAGLRNIARCSGRTRANAR